MSRMHHVLRLIKRDAFDFSNNQSFYLNQTIFHDTNQTSNDEYETDYNDRVKYFEINCESFRNVHSFLTLAVNYLLNTTEETYSTINESTQDQGLLENMTSFSFIDNMTLETSGISKEYAYSDYNLTIDELNGVLEEVKANVQDDPVISEIVNLTDFAYDMINSGIEEANSLPIISNWLFEMENFTLNYFNTNECASFQDCLQYTFSILYDLYSDMSIEGTELNRKITVEIEDTFLKLILNEPHSTIDIYWMANDLNTNLVELSEADMFCSSPPTFSATLKNFTVVSGGKLSLNCNVTGDPYPNIWWYYNGSCLNNETSSELNYLESTSVHSGFYHCVAGNVVVNITSKTAYIHVTGTYLKVYLPFDI